MRPRNGTSGIKLNATYTEVDSQKVFEEVEVSGYSATPLGRALLDLRQTCEQIVVLLQLLELLPAISDPRVNAQTKADLGFFLAQHLVLKICCFLNTEPRVMREVVKTAEGKELLAKLRPIREPLIANRKRFWAYRCQLIAHGQEKGELRHPLQRILRGAFPTVHADVALIGNMCCALTANLEKVYVREWRLALEEYRAVSKLLAPVIQEYESTSSVKSLADVTRVLEDLLQRVKL